MRNLERGPQGTEPRITRRNLIKGVGLLGLTLLLGGCGRERKKASTSPTAESKVANDTTAIEITSVAEVAAKPESLPAWPETAKEVVALFGGTPDRWEKNPDGGWHLREESYRILIDPHGYLAEGYWDTEPGKNPACVASAGVSIEIQGGTIWPVQGTEERTIDLAKRMAIPVWDDKSQHSCQVVLPPKK